MRVLMLGPFEVRGDDDRPIEVAGTRVRALLARLAMEPGRVVSVDALTTAIWEDRPPAGANALQALVSRVRRMIGGGRVEGRPPGYRLVIDAAGVDAVRFEQLVVAGRESADLAMLWEAESLWRGPALADLRELRFAADVAVRLEQLRLSASGDRLALEIAAGNDVLDELRPLADAHPLAERLQGLLVRALYAVGRQADALAAYERTRDRLADELGIDPSDELASLHLAVLRQDPDLPTRRRRTNLRVQVTSFVGREDDLARLVSVLDGARLVTMVGPGGAGKTRLAVEFAARAAGTGPDGVWLAELAAVTDPVEVASAVLAAIGVREAGLLAPSTGDAASRLVELFSRQRALLILDNCEHVVVAVAELVDRLLGSCPELRVVATSREPLAIGGEHLFPIRPLRWPSPKVPGEPAADDVATYPAVRLFVERATAVCPDFVLRAGNAPAVVEICRRLDGMPLAIELAAARMRVLSVEQIAAKLDDRFVLLSGGSRTAVPRHRTLRAVIDWSWALLSEPERDLAMRLAVFPAGAALDALDRAAHDPHAQDNVDVLTGLVDKSLVERLGERYRMLETIRSYALERLADTGRGLATRSEHARYFLQLAETADAQLRTADQLPALARLDAERDNIVAALRFAVDTGDVDLGVRLVAAMFWFWALRGIQTERLQWTQAVLDIAGAAPDGHRAVICVLDGLMKYETGAVEAGERAVTRGIALSRRPGGLDPSPGRALLLIAPMFLEGRAATRAAQRRLPELSGWDRGITLLLSTTAADEGDAAAVFDRLREAEREFEKLGERFGMSLTLRLLAEHHTRQGDLRQAVAALTQAVAPVEELGITGDGAEIFAELATALARTGDLDRAQVAIQQARHRAEDGGETHTLAYVRLAHAEYLLRRGDREAALRELNSAESGFADTARGGRVRMLCAGFRAMAAVLDGDTVTACRRLDAAIAAGLTGVEMLDLAAAAHMYAAIAVHDGTPAQAAYLIGVATALTGAEDRRGYDNLLRPADRARELLGAHAYTAAYDRGAALTCDAAIEVLQSDPLPASLRK